MAKDKRKIIKLKKRKSLSVDYEDKMKEIMHLRSVLTKVIASLISLIVVIILSIERNEHYFTPAAFAKFSHFNGSQFSRPLSCQFRGQFLILCTRMMV